MQSGHGVLGEANVYVHAAGVTRFVTTLTVGSDYTGVFRGFADATYSLSPDGADLLLPSSLNKTAYDAHGHIEIYDYKIATPVGSPPTCLTCRTDGSAPTGDASLLGAALRGGGRFFFTTSDALVLGDVNGRKDVYEYVPPGLGEPSGFFLISTGQVVHRLRQSR